MRRHAVILSVTARRAICARNRTRQPSARNAMRTMMTWPGRGRERACGRGREGQGTRVEGRKEWRGEMRE
eukprot:30770-Rhodomonas_salina.3